MSLLNLLGIARSALLTHQAAMSVTGHNIANAQTPGYSRQRLVLVPESPGLSPLGPIGRGVTSQALERVRSAFLDLSVRADGGRLGDAGARLEVLRGVDDALLEPGDGGVGAAFDGLLQSFSDLSGEPGAGTFRELVRSAAQRFVSQVRRVGAALDAAEAGARTRLQAGLDEVNAIASDLAEIHQRLATFGSEAPPDLLDRRDALLDRLAAFGTVRVSQQADGAVQVSLGAEMLVVGGTARALEVRALAGGGVGVARVGAVSTFDPGAGSLQALATLVTTTVPGMKAKLDAYVSAAVTEVNTVHRAGFTLTGATGVDFFDPAGLTASTISVSAAVTASSDAIAAAQTAAPGDGDNALRMAGLGGVPVGSLGGRSLREHYASFVADVGAQTLAADRDGVLYQTLVDRGEARRQSVSGVSVDEEMVALISQQQAYSAAARLVRAADDMITELLRMI